MSKRRTFGSVRRLPSGRWQASYHHPVTHQRVSGPTTYATKREATTWLSLAEADLVRGDDLDPTAAADSSSPTPKSGSPGRSSCDPRPSSCAESSSAPT